MILGADLAFHCDIVSLESLAGDSSKMFNRTDVVDSKQMHDLRIRH